MQYAFNYILNNNDVNLYSAISQSKGELIALNIIHEIVRKNNVKTHCVPAAKGILFILFL